MLSHAHAQSQADCIEKIERAAIATGLIQKYYMEGRKPVVVVKESMWNQMDFATKTGVAETFDCATAGPGMSLVNVQYISNMSGKVLHVWDGLKLIAQ